jgi:hypothetical protein
MARYIRKAKRINKSHSRAEAWFVLGVTKRPRRLFKPDKNTAFLRKGIVRLRIVAVNSAKDLRYLGQMHNITRRDWDVNIHLATKEHKKHCHFTEKPEYKQKLSLDMIATIDW